MIQDPDARSAIAAQLEELQNDYTGLQVSMSQLSADAQAYMARMEEQMGQMGRRLHQIEGAMHQCHVLLGTPSLEEEDSKLVSLDDFRP